MSLFEPASSSLDEHKINAEGKDGTTCWIEYYTDPLCSWCWAFEAQWRHLCYECAERLQWHYRMGGLIANWRGYDDPFNAIQNPAQMGPQWFQVREFSGMPLDEKIWHSDPPGSSYPACLAVKAAERQGPAIAEQYLRRLREAVMLERRNIARQEILLAAAQEVKQIPSQEEQFDLDRFRADLNAPETVEAFRQDLRDAAYYGIGRFPTLILRRNNGRSLILVGYRPYDALCAAVDSLVPDIRQKHALPREDLIVDYVQQWRSATVHELAEVLGEQLDQTSQLLNALIVQKKLKLANDSPGRTPLYIPIPD
ncbi:DsbA family oxidoreductase [Ktedonosporobacter rubrisoli]|uniref:DsbA family oxidoreductase n=1 Tax=Ktedonosporobacter rubrisoli TaxID=2509675 RepID=UPI0013EEAB08|nr:DsbA family protein [Ktedonosporobacter rubrisoli]